MIIISTLRNLFDFIAREGFFTLAMLPNIQYTRSKLSTAERDCSERCRCLERTMSDRWFRFTIFRKVFRYCMIRFVSLIPRNQRTKVQERGSAFFSYVKRKLQTSSSVSILYTAVIDRSRPNGPLPLAGGLKVIGVVIKSLHG